jgi:hypothetical protein
MASANQRARRPVVLLKVPVSCVGHHRAMAHAVLIIVVVVVGSVMLTQGDPFTAPARSARGETPVGRAVIALFQAIPLLRKNLREPWRSGRRGRRGAG